jgi:hypothetical protein
LLSFAILFFIIKNYLTSIIELLLSSCWFVLIVIKIKNKEFKK